MKIRVLIGAWLLAVASGSVHPLGLGEILVNSRLNQPLDAEILVREATPGEAENLVAKLAAQEDYARVGLERARLPVLLRFETGTNARGQTVIRVRSDEPVREPFMTLLVEANWSGGRLLREYGVLLDPPVAAPASRIARVAPPPAAAPPPVAVTPPPAAPSPPAETVAMAPDPAPIPAPPPAVREPPPAAVPAPSPPPVASAPSRPPPGFAPRPDQVPSPAALDPMPSRVADGTYTVQRGDTLTGIASRFAADAGVTTNQMMLALQRDNPRAFFADNINALRAGAVLRIPDAGASAELGRAEASAEVRRQVESWTGVTPALADAGAAPVAIRPSVTAAPADARLELLPPAADTPGSEAAGRAGTDQGGAQMAEVQAELQRTREDLRSREQEQTELASRVRDLEQLNAQNARLLELKDAEVAELQRRLAEATAATPPAALEQPTAPDPLAPELAGEPEFAQPELPADALAANDTDAASADAIADFGEPAAEDLDQALAADPSLADPRLGETDAIDPAGEDAWAAATTAGEADPFADSQTAARADDWSAAPEPAVGDAATPAQATEGGMVSETTSTTGAPAPAVQPWYLNPMVQGAALIAIALILLLVWLARRQRTTVVVEDEPRRSVSALFNEGASTGGLGAASASTVSDDDARALQAQILADPEDRGAYLELLSLYYAENDRDQFETWAERFYEVPGAEGSVEWDQVRGMGEELLPEHPLFAVDGDAEPEDAVDRDYVSPPSGSDDDEAPIPPPAPISRVVDIGGTDFRMDAEDEDEDADDQSMPIEYRPEDLDVIEPAAAPSLPEREEADEDNAEALPPLVFGDDERRAAPATTTAIAADADGDGDGDGLDDAATKLELARAYLDMGDPDGARAMLEEVLGEGDTSQREEARKLLATL